MAADRWEEGGNGENREEHRREKLRERERKGDHVRGYVGGGGEKNRKRREREMRRKKKREEEGKAMRMERGKRYMYASAIKLCYFQKKMACKNCFKELREEKSTSST